ncbi:MAG TPA: STAS domain-containing protein, partial [Bauldia sp.]|nr:STAS domain-containing protein [Bauldia sp.]
MADSQIIAEAALARRTVGDTVRIVATGTWSIETVAGIEGQVAETVRGGGQRVTVDLSGVTYIDTAGAWLISRIEETLRAGGAAVTEVGASPNARRLLDAVEPALHIPVEEPEHRLFIWKLLELLGRSVVNSGRDFLQAMSILGGVVQALLRAVRRPSRFRFTSIVYHLDRTGLQAVPIVCLISLLLRGGGLRRRPRRHPDPARDRRAPHRDHARRPLGQRLHGGDRLDEDAGGARCAEGDRPRPDRGPDHA